jgi:hypothetical protein
LDVTPREEGEAAQDGKERGGKNQRRDDGR